MSTENKSLLEKRTYGSVKDRLEKDLEKCPFCGASMRFHEERADFAGHNARKLYVQCSQCRFTARFPTGFLKDESVENYREKNEKVYIKTSNFWNRLKRRSQVECI